ncbi:nucleolar pre-ribosomal-associated protein 1-like isoform X3 [Dysidea avara]|uniref:nucleolar pre-ribosomal-associated protein 1-like isoform X3 n=1 Tax=Dysidea avara TaxID=196820 RepID=UPI00331E4A3E
MATEGLELCKKFLELSSSKEPKNVVAGLNLFLKEVDSPDFLAHYVKLSKDCGELCAALEWDKQQRTHNVVLLCFQCIEQVYLKAAATESSDELRSAGHNLAINMINNHIKIFYTVLSPSSTNMLTAVGLRLLAVMVTQGPSVARELLHNFNFSYKSFEALPSKAGHINKKVGSIRLCFIHFAVSFLIIGTNNIIQEVLSLKGFLSRIFSLLTNDTAEVVYLVLNTITEKVVQNLAIPKRTKSAFFTPALLTKLTLLLSRKEEIQCVERVILLSDYCRDFIVKLSTDFQCGICYKSKGIPSAWGRSNNPTLLQFLFSLKEANQDSCQQQIVIAILKTCPDLLIPYLNNLSYSFEHKSSPKWMSNMEFIFKVYSSIVEIPHILEGLDYQQCLSCVDTAVHFTVPSCVSRIVLSQGVQNADITVKYTTLNLMIVILRRSGDVIDWYSDSFTDTTGEDFLLSYCDGVLKCLPDVKTIISLRQLLHSKDNSLLIKDDHGSEKIESSNVLRQTMEVLCGYQRLSHDILSASGFDLTRLLTPVKTSDDLPDNLVEILTLLLGAPAGSLKWHQPKNTLLSSLIYIMAKASGVATNIASRILKRLITELPTSHGYEVDIIVDSLLSHLQCRLYSNHQLSSLVDTLVDCFKLLASNPTSVMDTEDVVKGDIIQDVSLESILACDIELPDLLNDTPRPHTNLSSGYVTSPVWLKLVKRCPSEVLLLPLVTEVSLKLLITSDHPTGIADTILYYLFGNETVQQFTTCSLKWLYHDLIVSVLPWRSGSTDNAFLSLFNEDDKPVRTIKRILQSGDDGIEAQLFEYLSSIPTTQLSIMFSDVWKLCSKEMSDGHGRVLLQQYLSIRPMSVEAMMLQTLPKVQQDDEMNLAEPPAKKQRTSLPSSSYTNSFYMAKSIASHFDVISETIIKSSCKELFMIAKSLVRIVSFLSCEDVKGKSFEILHVHFQLFAVLTNIISHIISNEGLLFTNKSVLKCGNEECCCLLTMETIFSNPVMQNNFLSTPPAYVESKVSFPKKQKKTVSLDYSTLICGLITTVLKMNPQLVDMPCIKLYFDKTTTVLTAPDISSSSLSALKDLAPYMKPDAVSAIMDNILSSVLVTDECSPVKMMVVVELLHILQLGELNTQPVLSHDGFVKLLNICNSYHSDVIDDLLLNVLQAHINTMTRSENRQCLASIAEVLCSIDPSLTKLCSEQILEGHDLSIIDTGTIANWISHPSSARVRLTELVISNCKKHMKYFTTMGIDLLSETISDNSENILLFLPLIKSYLQLKEVQMSKSFLKVLWKYCSRQLISSSADQELCSEVLIFLIDRHMTGNKKLKKLFTNLQTVDHLQWNNYQLPVVSRLVSLLNDDVAVTMFLVHCLKMLNTLFSGSSVECCDEDLIFTVILDVIKKYQPCGGFDDILLTQWNSFVKLTLKYRLHSPAALDVLNHFIIQLYHDENNVEKLIQIGDIFEMIWNHSQFLEIMLATTEVNQSKDDMKENLMRLLLTTFDPGRSTKYHFAVLLAAYQPNLALTNQHILCLMQKYEIHETDTAEFSPYLWGKTAVSQFRERQKKGWVLCMQPGMSEVLDMLDKNVLKQSILEFPIDLSLEPSSNCNQAHDKKKFDPRFLLPLFSHLLDTGNLVDCRKFVSHGCVGYLLAAISSHDRDVRAAAYHCLARYYTHLEGSRFREKDQIILLLDVLQNSVEVDNTRISCVHSLFLYRCMEIFLTPEHDLYPVLANFIVYKPVLDLQEVPMFYLLVHSSSNQHKLERQWIMSLLKEGLRSDQDYPVYRRRNVIPILMTHYSSVLTDSSMKLQILLLIKQASHLVAVTTDLIWNRGLLAWLQSIVDSTSDSNKISMVCNIVKNLWSTVGSAASSFSSFAENETADTIDDPSTSRPCVHIPHIEREMSLLLSRLLLKM